MLYKSLIGRPYSTEWTCWSLIEYFYPQFKDLELEITDSIRTSRKIADSLLTDLKSRYVFTDDPQHLDIVMLNSQHVGVLLMPERSVMHVDKNMGTVVESEMVIKSKYPQARFIHVL